jgi:hypothetical protein
VTTWSFGTVLATSGVARNDLIASKTYPTGESLSFDRASESVEILRDAARNGPGVQGKARGGSWASPVTNEQRRPALQGLAPEGKGFSEMGRSQVFDSLCFSKTKTMRECDRGAKGAERAQ